MMNDNRVFSYFNDENYDYLMKTKANLILDGYSNISLSKIIQLSMIELRNNNEYTDIKEKLLEMDMIQ